MTDSTPISPPTVSTSTTTPPPNSAEPGPISPVGKTGSFEHKTSGSFPPKKPFIDTSTPAINDTPVEIDGVPTSPEELKRRETSDSTKISPGLGEEEEINAEFLGEGEPGVGKGLRQKRAELLASRSKDPGVIVDLPPDPTAEEVEAAKSAEGTVTPGIPPAEFESDTKR